MFKFFGIVLGFLVFSSYSSAAPTVCVIDDGIFGGFKSVTITGEGDEFVVVGQLSGGLDPQVGIKNFGPFAATLSVKGSSKTFYFQNDKSPAHKGILTLVKSTAGGKTQVIATTDYEAWANSLMICK